MTTEMQFPLMMTYGELPSKEVFETAWEVCDRSGGLRDGLFHFGNDRRVGTDAFTCDQLWNEVKKAHSEYTASLQETPGTTAQDPEKAGSWVADVLSCLENRVGLNGNTCHRIYDPMAGALVRAAFESRFRMIAVMTQDLESRRIIV